MANANNEIFYDEDYIESILNSLELLESYTDQILAAIESLSQYLSDNNMTGVESKLKDDITNLRNFFNTDYKKMIETSQSQINLIGDNLEKLDRSGGKNVH